MNRRDYLKKKAVKTKSININAYKKMRNHVNKVIKKAKTCHFNQTIDGNINNPKKMWRNINQLIGRGSKTTQV